MKFVSTCAHQSKMLNENQIYDATSHCPLCGSKQPRKSIAVIQKSPIINLLSCDICDGVSASRMPKQEILNEYYSQYYKSAHEQHITFHDPKRFAKHILRFIPFEYYSNSEFIDILDYGGGDGTLSIEVAYLLKKKRVNITVVDYDESLPPLRKGIIVKKIRNLKDVGNKTYDIILASTVLEHIPEPKPIMENLFSLLKPNGYFYARTPYMVPIMKVIRNVDFTYPGHLHDMGPLFWNRVIETFQLDAVAISSRPSIVASSFSKTFVRTLAAYLLKFPTLIELKVNKAKKVPIWKYVGGWEFILKRSL